MNDLLNFNNLRNLDDLLDISFNGDHLRYFNDSLNNLLDELFDLNNLGYNSKDF